MHDGLMEATSWRTPFQLIFALTNLSGSIAIERGQDEETAGIPLLLPGSVSSSVTITIDLAIPVICCSISCHGYWTREISTLKCHGMLMLYLEKKPFYNPKRSRVVNSVDSQQARGSVLVTISGMLGS